MMGKKKTKKPMYRKRGAVLVVKRGTISDERVLAKLNKPELLKIAAILPDEFDRFGNPAKGKIARKYLRNIYGMSNNDIDKYVNEQKSMKRNKEAFVNDVKRFYRGEISESVLTTKWGKSIAEIESQYKEKVFDAPEIPMGHKQSKQLYRISSPVVPSREMIIYKGHQFPFYDSNALLNQQIMSTLDSIIDAKEGVREIRENEMMKDYNISKEVLSSLIRKRMSERGHLIKPSHVPYMKTPTGQRSFSIWGYGLYDQYKKLPPEKRKEFLLGVVDKHPEFAVHIAHILSGGSPNDDFVDVVRKSYKTNKDLLKKEMQEYLLRKRIDQLKKSDESYVKKAPIYSSMLESYRSGEYAHKSDLDDTSFADPSGFRRKKNNKISIKRKPKKVIKHKKVVKRCRCK